VQGVHRALAAAQFGQAVLYRVAGHHGGLLGGLGQRQSRGQPGRQGRRVGASGAVGRGDAATSHRDGQVARAVEEMINGFCAMSARDQRCSRAHRDQAFRQSGPVLGRLTGQGLGFGKIGGYHRGQREQARGQGSDRFGEQQPAAGAGHHDRIDHQRQVARRQRVGHGLDQRRGEQHAGLDGIGPDVIQHGVDLRPHEGRRQLVDGGHAQGVLRGERDDRRHAVRAAAGERLEVGLDAGPAPGVGRGDRKHPRHAPRAGTPHTGSSGRPSTGLEA
jgi:hypothetical protein